MSFQADRCLIARAENVCWDCGAIGQVVCIVLPYNRVMIAEGPDDDSLPPSDGAVMMAYIERISPELLAAIDRPSFKRAASRTAAMTYYANHCEHCGVLIGDHFLREPDGPFWPMSTSHRPIEITLFDHPVTILASDGSVSFPLGPYELGFEGPPRRLSRPTRRKE